MSTEDAPDPARALDDVFAVNVSSLGSSATGHLVQPLLRLLQLTLIQEASEITRLVIGHCWFERPCSLFEVAHKFFDVIEECRDCRRLLGTPSHANLNSCTFTERLTVPLTKSATATTCCCKPATRGETGVAEVRKRKTAALANDVCKPRTGACNFGSHTCHSVKASC
eukprot:6176080-Amphidinium_carterae.4